MTGVLLVMALGLLGVGVLVDGAMPEREKCAGSGWLGGSLRPLSKVGFRRGLPWYGAGVILFALALWSA